MPPENMPATDSSVDTAVRQLYSGKLYVAVRVDDWRMSEF
jgi:hypothetical protein